MSIMLKKKNMKIVNKTLKEESNTFKELKYAQLETKINSDENTIKELLEDKKKEEEKLQEIERELNSLKVKTNVKDFIAKNDEINKIENEREEVEKTIKSYRNRLEELSKNREDAIKDLNDTNQELAKD